MIHGPHHGDDKELGADSKHISRGRDTEGSDKDRVHICLKDMPQRGHLHRPWYCHPSSRNGRQPTPPLQVI